MTQNGSKDEFISNHLKGILNSSLMDTEKKQKNILQEAFNASWSEVFITDTQEPSKQEQTPRWMYLYF